MIKETITHNQSETPRTMAWVFVRCVAGYNSIMHIHEQVPLREYTTFKIGGPARFFVEASSVDELKEAIRFAQAKNLPFFILGGGSNLLIDDEGFPGVIIHIAIRGVEWKEENDHIIATIGAGEYWDNFVATTVEKNYSGVENLSSIPGTVGASAVQNIGAYGVEVGELIVSVDVYDAENNILRTLTNAECVFGYRDSIFKTNKNFIVTQVQFRLEKIYIPKQAYKDIALYIEESGVMTLSLSEMREAIVSIRAKKFPDLSTYGTAGSFFKNPVVTEAQGEEFLRTYPTAPHYLSPGNTMKLSAAWIIDHVLNMKGVRDGDVGTWNAQALVVVNYDRATSKDVKKFVQKITDASFEKIKISLEPEVVFVPQ